MNKKLLRQTLILMVFALVLAVINNLRPSAKIEWVRNWPSYKSIAAKPEPKKDVLQEDVVQAPADNAGSPEATAELVTNNNGITDIGIEQAHQIFNHARDYTLWIDARSPELFEKGRIASAHLLHFYEKNAYLPEIEAQIAETQPVALVIYCKGQDCTDSHHLAQDLAAMGYANIFVYKDGFDDWRKAGYPIEGEMADAEPEVRPNATDQEAETRVAEMVTGNSGITDIDLEQAAQIFRHGSDFTLWIDARSPELFEKGHIQGAHLLHLYEKNVYLPEIQNEIAALQPVALVVYCKGKDCTDSHHLAQDLEAIGFGNIFVYKGGFDEWLQAGYAIEGELAAAAAVAETDAPAARDALEAEKPAGMYLEHVIRDMVPFLLGLIMLVLWKKTSVSKGWLLAGCWVAGLFFIYAAMPKIANPMLFAKNIWNYDIAPAAMINFSALLLPMVELIAAVCIITGVYRKSGGLLISVLLVIFMVAVGFNVLRGHDFDCGCTASEPLAPAYYLVGWNDKFTLLLRDFGLLVMSVLAFRSVKPE